MPRPFRFSARMPGMSLPMGPNVAPEGVFATASWRDALLRMEDVGFSAVSVFDHLVVGSLFEQFTALMAVAGATRHLRLGAHVACNDFRHPVVLHKAAA